MLYNTSLNIDYKDTKYKNENSVEYQKQFLKAFYLEKYDENEKKKLSKLIMTWKDPDTVKIEEEGATTKQLNIANNNSSSNYVAENM